MSFGKLCRWPFGGDRCNQDGFASLGNNLIQYSHQLGNAASGGWWTDGGLTSVTANGAVAPDGTTTADGLVGIAFDTSKYVITDFITGVAQNDKVALTAFAKPGDNDHVKITVNYYNSGGGSIGDQASYYFNVDSGIAGTKSIVGDSTVHDLMIEPAGNDFYRIGIIASNSDADTDRVKILLLSAEADNDDVFTGDASTVNTWFWGADLKKQDFFSSYDPMPTTGLWISGVTSDRGGTTVLYDATRAEAADFWNYGRLICMVGGASQERKVVDFISGGTLVFDVPMSADISGLTKYDLKAGCPKTWTACSAVSAWGPSSGNTVNYGGFPFMARPGDWKPQEG